MKINLSRSTSSDPRLQMEEGEDPRWWDQDSPPTTKKTRQGYGNNAQLPEASPGVAQRESIEELFDAALAGFLPRSRALKPWEPDKLNPRHLQAINMKAAGFSQNKIAELLDLEPSTVSIIINHPDAQYLLARIIAYAAENVVDMENRLRATAPLAHEKLLEILTTSKKEESIIRVGFGFLDRAGYGATQKVEEKKTVTFVVPREEAGLLRAAINEARDIQEADYVVLGSEASPTPIAASQEDDSPNEFGLVTPGSPVTVRSEGGHDAVASSEDSSSSSAGGSQDILEEELQRKMA